MDHHKERSKDADLVLIEGTPSNDTIYDVLSKRLRDGNIYTYLGDVLISVNPYTTVQGLYGKQVIDQYAGSTQFQLEPHVYAIGENMYKNLRDSTRDQCVLISGESGAGKTEASKKIMEHVAAVSRAGGAVGRVAGMLLGSNPILEAFGNAKTIRNDNSSRFGKYMEIVFDYRAVPFGGRITNYLLEKVRVVSRSKSERSFHIFYMMLAGLPDGELSQLGLKRDPNAYRYLQRSECVTVPGFDDKREFGRVAGAMKVLGFTPDIQNSVWRALAGILILGDVEFVKGRTQDASKPQDPALLEKIASLWRVPVEGLTAALVSRTFATGVGNKQTMRKGGVNSPLTVDGANDARDALAKAMYSGVFDFCVAQLNKAMAPPEDLRSRRTLGILDIYGFEIFEDNSFEQWCINWCNEKLQQYFIELTLREEQEDYAREGIPWVDVEYFDNKVICDLIEQPPAKAGRQNGPKPGLLALLNEACVLKNTSDQDFLHTIEKTHKESEFFSVPGMGKGKPTMFQIKHYAGNVGYKIEGFIEKNNDKVFTDQRKLVEKSEDQIIRTLMQNASTDDVKRPESAGTKFKSSLANLIQTLSLCQPSYVRCIKPNETKSALKADPERFKHQINYLGLLENLKIRKAGFCNRQTYEEFLQRYKMTVPRGPGSCWPVWKGSAKEGCLVIIKHFKWEESHYALGKTKVFIRNPKELFELENARANAMPMVAAMIQSALRGHFARVYWHHLKAIVTIQKRFRGYKCVVSYGQKRAATRVIGCIKAAWERQKFAHLKATVFLQAMIRAQSESARFAKLKATICIQDHVRAHAERLVLEKKKAISVIQAGIRCVRQKERLKMLRQVVLIQSASRATLERRKFHNATAAFKIQALAKARYEREHVRRELAGRMIKKNLKLLVRRVWLKQLVNLYADAKKKNQWGRGFHAQWDKFQAPCAVDVSLFDRMEETWRYRNLLNSIKTREQVYREKVMALDAFSGKKPWEPAALWGDHNYLASELNPTAEAFKLAYGQMPDGDKQVFFSDLVDKMNPNGKMVERGILLTEKGFYRMTPGKYKPDKHNALSDIKKITMTKQSDNLVVLHHETSRDSIINFGAVIGSLKKPQLRRTRSYSDMGGKKRSSLMLEDAPRARADSVATNRSVKVADVAKEGDDESERYSEFVVQILSALQQAGLPAPTVEFENEIEVNVSKKQGQPQMVKIMSANSDTVPNSFWESGKHEHKIYATN